MRAQVVAHVLKHGLTNHSGVHNCRDLLLSLLLLQQCLLKLVVNLFVVLTALLFDPKDVFFHFATLGQIPDHLLLVLLYSVQLALNLLCEIFKASNRFSLVFHLLAKLTLPHLELLNFCLCLLDVAKVGTRLLILLLLSSNFVLFETSPNLVHYLDVCAIRESYLFLHLQELGLQYGNKLLALLALVFLVGDHIQVRLLVDCVLLNQTGRSVKELFVYVFGRADRSWHAFASRGGR